MELHSCHCLFDTCLISKVKKESFQDLGNRLSDHMSEIYAGLKRKGLCGCSFCRPAGVKTKLLWVLRTKGNELSDIPEKRYAACKDHVERIIDNITLSTLEKITASGSCQSRPLFETRYQGKYPSCLFFCHEDIITLFGFCLQCKLYFASLSEFKLKRIKTVEDYGNRSTLG